MINYLRRQFYNNKYKYYSYKVRFDPEKYIDQIKNEINFKLNPIKYVFLCIDDLCLYDGQNGTLDYGGDQEGYVKTQICSLLDRFPELAITFFLIPSPTFIGNGLKTGLIKHQKHYDISNFKIFNTCFPWLLNFKDRVEFAVHGNHHNQTLIKQYHPYAEFLTLDNESAVKNVADALNKFSMAGYSPIGFKPPAWVLNRSDNFQIEEFVNGIQKLGIQYVSLSTPMSGLNREKKIMSHVFPSKIGECINLPQNINLNWDDEYITRVLKEIIFLGGMVVPQIHSVAKSNDMNDGIGLETIRKIELIINTVKEYDSQYQFATLRQIFGTK